VSELGFPWVASATHDAKVCGEFLARAIEGAYYLDRVRWRFFVHGKPPHDREDGHQYRRKKVLGRNMSEHWMVWIVTYRELPAPGYEIDHVNRDKRDNRVENLRLARHGENQRNRDILASNTIGFVGVMQRKDGHRERPFMASIYDKRRAHTSKHKIFIGSFPSAEQAALARDEFCRRIDPTYWTLNADLAADRLKGHSLSCASMAVVDRRFNELFADGSRDQKPIILRAQRKAAPKKRYRLIHSDYEGAKRTGIACAITISPDGIAECSIRVARHLASDASEDERTMVFVLGCLPRKQAVAVGTERYREVVRELLGDQAAASL
jgi:hypothetical protein